MTIKKHLINLAIFFILFILSLGISYGVYVYDLRSEVIFLIYVVAVLICVIETKNIYYALMLSVLFVMSFNFFFTEPFFTFKVDDPSYLISFIIFVVVCLIVGTLVTKLQNQIIKSKENEFKIKSLYDLSNYLNYEKREAKIFTYITEYLSNVLEKEITIIDKKFNIYGAKLDTNKYKNEIIYCLDNTNMLVKDYKIIKDNKLFVPIFSKVNHYGVLLINNKDREMRKEETEFLYSYLGHLLVTLDKDYITEKEREIKKQVETEKFRTTLLRSLSHDLKTPLTSIQSGSLYLLENDTPETAKNEIIKGIYEESCDLQTFVENLLLMTKASKPSMLQKKKELVDDIIALVRKKIEIQKFNNKKINFIQNEEIIFVYADSQLLVQVLVNIIDNAIKHTKDNTTINVSYKKEVNKVRFIVSDNGGGIIEDMKEKIFEDYFSVANKGDRKKSSGLGLGICKSIVNAHNGTIDCFNNEEGGATFTFTIPDKEVDYGKDINN